MKGRSTKNLRILSIIPARGGSKSIPRKNIFPVAGKPLIAWSILPSLSSKYITKTVVSSDDKEILEISEKFGATPIKRPKKYASDSATMMPVITDCIKQLERKSKKFDILILLQPTSPLRTTKDINDAFEVFFKNKTATSLISGYEPSKSPFKSFVVDDRGFLKGIVNNKFPFMSRQDLPKTFYPNGSIYIIYVKNFLKGEKLFTTRTVPFLMSAEKNIDIDTVEDLKEVGKIIKKVHNAKT